MGMLILTRRIGETLYIGDDVLVTVLGVRRNQIRVGITAPKTTPVHREEIYERVKKEKEAVAANPKTRDGITAQKRPFAMTNDKRPKVATG